MLADYARPEAPEPLGQMILQRPEYIFVAHPEKDTEQPDDHYFVRNGRGNHSTELANEKPNELALQIERKPS